MSSAEKILDLVVCSLNLDSDGSLQMVWVTGVSLIGFDESCDLRGKDEVVCDCSPLGLRFLSGVLLNLRILQLAGLRRLL